MSREPTQEENIADKADKYSRKCDPNKKNGGVNGVLLNFGFNSHAYGHS